MIVIQRQRLIWAICTVCLLAVFTACGSRTVLQRVALPSAAPVKNVAPVSICKAAPLPRQVSQKINFSDNGSYDLDGHIVKWEWNFGDKNSGWVDYTATAGKAYHTYTAAGTYNARLRVTDDGPPKVTSAVTVKGSKSNQSSLKVTISGGGVLSNIPPVALFTAAPLTGSAPQTVNFDASDSYSYDADGYVDTYEWDWDNTGNWTSPSANPLAGHVYTKPGTYTAVLRVTDDNMLQGTPVSLKIDVQSSEWAHTYGTSQYDSLYGACTDNNGHIYGTGIIGDVYTATSSAFVSKWDTAGNLLWAHTWGAGSYAWNCASDGNNVYVTAFLNDPYSGTTILKFDGSGNLLWQQQYSLPNGFALLDDIEVDAFGDMIVGGAFQSDSFASNLTNLLLAKLDPVNGTIIWDSTWDSGAYEYGYNIDECNGEIGMVAIWGDFNVNIYADSLALKFDASDDSLKWARKWSVPGRSGSSAFGAALATDGSLYSTTGDQWAGTSAVQKFDSAGNLLWTENWLGPAFNFTSGITLDASDNAYVTGYSNAPGTGIPLYCLTLQKFDKNGNLLADELWSNGLDSYGYSGPAVLLNGSLYLPAETANATGSWQAPTLFNFSQTSEVPTVIGGTSVPANLVLAAGSGSVGTPSGVIDTGGGGQDALLIRHAAP